MPRSETTTVFAGVDGRADAPLPDWYATQHASDPSDLGSFSEAIRQLPRAVETSVAYHNPYTDSWVEPSRLVPTDRGSEQVEPDGGTTSPQSTTDDAGREHSREPKDALFHIPTRSYSVINTSDVYTPFEEVLRETTIDGHGLGDLVFGEIRQYRGGGEVHMDIMFDGLSVELPDRRDPDHDRSLVGIRHLRRARGVRRRLRA